MRVLTLDLGSSSLKFALFEVDRNAQRELHAGEFCESRSFAEALDVETPDAIGHRIVVAPDGYEAPARLDLQLYQALKTTTPRDPLHLPRQLDLIRVSRVRFPSVPQILCFDTAFFARLPQLARRLPLPSNLPVHIRRNGFHGLSYESAMRVLGNPRGRVVVAHLGSGASLCALLDAVPVETTFGFGVLGGLVMSTRPGDLDPSILLELLSHGVSVPRLSAMLYEDSGLKGVSGTSGDMRKLLAARQHDERAEQAVDLFVHELRKHLGAMIASLGGIDTLVFTGGIGECAAEVRARACKAFEYIGLSLDDAANAVNANVISAAASSVAVRIVTARENEVIARHVWHVLEPDRGKEDVGV